MSYGDKIKIDSVKNCEIEVGPNTNSLSSSSYVIKVYITSKNDYMYTLEFDYDNTWKDFVKYINECDKQFDTDFVNYMLRTQEETADEMFKIMGYVKAESIYTTVIQYDKVKDDGSIKSIIFDLNMEVVKARASDGSACYVTYNERICNK